MLGKHTGSTPSVKALTIQQVADVAHLFTQLANDLNYQPGTRPNGWNKYLAMLLPKEDGATTLDRHRAIALMGHILDPLISEHQAGFRRTRQASEIQSFGADSWSIALFCFALGLLSKSMTPGQAATLDLSQKLVHDRMLSSSSNSKGHQLSRHESDPPIPFGT